MGDSSAAQPALQSRVSVSGLGDPEWAGQTQGNNGGPASSSSAAVDPEMSLQATHSKPSDLPSDVDEMVKKAIELAQSRCFDDAERCLSEISTKYPDYASVQQVDAAWQTIRLCRSFHRD